MKTNMKKIFGTVLIAGLVVVSCTKQEQQPADPSLAPQAIDSQTIERAAPGTTPAPADPNAPPSANAVGPDGQPVAQAQVVPIAPYRTWVVIEGFVMENNGEPENPISNVRLDLKLPGNDRIELPGNGQFWTIGNGQIQEIKRTYEVPYSSIAHDGFVFSIQMVRKGSDLLPCVFEVRQLSQFNRRYVCHTDVPWQVNQKVPENQIEREGIEVRVMTDRNTPPKDIPKDAIALK